MDIRLGLLQVGDIMIGAVNAEVFNPIAQRLKKESPYARTMMATLTNGSARSGYIRTRCRLTACICLMSKSMSSRLQAGLCESAIVSGILDLMVVEGQEVAARTGPYDGLALLNRSRRGDGTSRDTQNVVVGRRLRRRSSRRAMSR